MPTVEYCDNINCRLNRKRSCTSIDIEFDENGICATANYDEDPKRKAPYSGRQGDSGAGAGAQDGNEITEHDIPSLDKDNSWVKYI